MMDSGAQVCVCPEDYAPEIPLQKDMYDMPALQTVNGNPIKVYGHKYVNYDLETITGDMLNVTVKYYVTDCHMPVVSTGLTTTAGYEVHLTANGATFGLRDQQVRLQNFDGLNYLVINRSYRRRALQSVLLSTPLTTENRQMTIAVSRRSGYDYWRIDENVATRVHVNYRTGLFIPSLKTCMPGSEITTDPWLHQLGPMRTTHVRFADGRTDTIQDEKNTTCMLPEKWKGETKFQIIEELNIRDTTSMIVDEPVGHYSPEPDVQDSTTSPPSSSQPSPQKMTTSDSQVIDSSKARTTNLDVDHWEFNTTTWIRHHVVPRRTLFAPDELADDPQGPTSRDFQDTRTTLAKLEDGTTESIEDNWRNPLQKSKQLFIDGQLWTGTTTFMLKPVFPQVIVDDVTEEANAARGLRTPQEPTEAERELHNLTHLPFRAWCKQCVMGKGKKYYGKQQKQLYDTRPVIQVDYCFIHHLLLSCRSLS